MKILFANSASWEIEAESTDLWPGQLFYVLLGNFPRKQVLTPKRIIIPNMVDRSNLVTLTKFTIFKSERNIAAAVHAM